MKKQINDLLLKMQTGENCIGETANKLLDLYSVSVSLPLPIDAHSIEVFAIKDSEHSPTGKEAFIGYKLKTGCFHFISVPYSGNDR